MALSAFADKSARPTRAAVAETLAGAATLWNELVSRLAAQYEPLDRTWSYAGAKWGWSLRLRRKKRTVMYLTPRAGSFVAGLALGEKAVRVAHERGLSPRVLALVDAAPKYAEGRAVRFEVETGDDLEDVAALAAIKMGT